MSCQYYCFAVLLWVFGATVFLLRRVYYHPLSHFPGPWLAATTGFIQFYVLWSGKEKAWYRDLHEKYGPVARCGPNHLSFNDPDMVPIVYHRQADKIGYPQDFSNPGAAVSKVNHVEFTAAKRQFGQAYSLTRVKLFEGAIDQQLAKWMSLLREEATQSPSVTGEKWTTLISFLGYDAFTPISFGESLGFLDTRSDVRQLIGSSYKIYKLQTLTRYPPIAWLVRNTALGRWIFIRLVSRRSNEHGVGLFMDEVHKIVQKRISTSAKEEKASYEDSMLDQWLSTRTAENKAIRVADIEDQIVTDLLGGPIAASATTTGIVFLLASYPDVLKQAQKEIDEAFTNKVLGESPTYDECVGLPFVSACVHEALRFNSTASPRGRCSPDRSLSLMGKYVPPGTAVSTSPFAISTHKKLYGDNADQFLPDRWLQASEEQLRLWNTFDAHWGFGVRKCPGRHIGIMVLYKFLVLLLRQFDLQLEKNAPVDNGTSLLMFPRNL